MNVEKLLTDHKHLNDIYRGLDIELDIQTHLDDFYSGYLAGYQGAMLALFDGYLDMIVDIENGESHNASTCKICVRRTTNES